MDDRGKVHESEGNNPFFLRCITCSEIYDPVKTIYMCRKCSSPLEVVFDLDLVARKMAKSGWRNAPLSVWKYHDILPIQKDEFIITLGEGGTRLHTCDKLGKATGISELYLKNEGENPTGSFKDRGMTVGISKALEKNSKVVLCASTGNTSASLSAYSAKAGITCVVFIPSGKIAYGKLAQAVAHGAKVVQVKGSFDDALKIVINLSLRYTEIYLLNSVNPFRLEGQKTLAFEVLHQLGYAVPDMVFVPVGNGGNISAIWKGFKEFKELDIIDRLPKMVGVQADGAAPLVDAFQKGKEELEPVRNPETIASAIRIGNPANWRKVLRAVRESGGRLLSVSDDEILSAQKDIARKEGLFVEPASTASYAGLKKLVEQGVIDRDLAIVCVATGHGLKDPDIVIQRFEKPLEVEADTAHVEPIMMELSGLTPQVIRPRR